MKWQSVFMGGDMKYHTVYADPPWAECGGVDEGLMSIIRL